MAEDKAEEKRALPPIALTAIRFVKLDYERNVQATAVEILEVMCLSPADGWRVNVAEGTAVRQPPQGGVATREVPEKG